MKLLGCFCLCVLLSSQCLAQPGGTGGSGGGSGSSQLSDDMIRWLADIRAEQQRLMDIIYDPNSQLTYDEVRDTINTIHVYENMFNASVAHGRGRDDWEDLWQEIHDAIEINGPQPPPMVPLPPPVFPGPLPPLPPGAPGNPMGFPIPNPVPNLPMGPLPPPLVPPPVVPPPLIPPLGFEEFLEDIGSLIAEIVS